MSTTFDEPDDGYKVVWFNGEQFYEHPNQYVSSDDVAAVIEPAERRDVIEEFTKNIDVSGWPKVGYLKGKFVPAGTAQPPASKVQKITKRNGEVIYVLWTPVPAKIESDDPVEIALAIRDGLPIAGWNLTYHTWDGHWCECARATYRNLPGVGLFHDACGRIRKHRNDGTALPNLSMPDDEYNGFYPTIKGNDPAHWDPTKKGMDAWRGGDIMYGQPDANGVRYPVTGREIRGGKVEYREATKNYYEWDEGYQRDVDKIRADAKAKRDVAFELASERADKQLPRKLGEV